VNELLKKIELSNIWFNFFFRNCSLQKKAHRPQFIWLSPTMLQTLRLNIFVTARFATLKSFLALLCNFYFFLI